jgi:uncharacterized protein (UPF0276 family)
MERKSNQNIQGLGLSARSQFFPSLLDPEINHPIQWLEFLTDNYFFQNTYYQENLIELTELYPHVFHCLGFNLGAIEDLNLTYLKKVKTLVQLTNPSWVSDHLSFCGIGGEFTPDLLPVVYNKEMLRLVGEKIKIISDYLEKPLLIENISYYLKYQQSTWTEFEFLAELVDRYPCELLLDVNNLIVNSLNFKFSAHDELKKLSIPKIKQIHIAGYEQFDNVIIDTHGDKITDQTLSFYQKNYNSFKDIPICLERDTNIPSFKDLLLDFELLRKNNQEVNLEA